MTTSPSLHVDILGNLINIGTYVAVPGQYELRLCKVIKMTNKMIRVEELNQKTPKIKSMLVYSSQTILVDEDHIIAYLLKNG
jgi:hypothetical protein